jgi:hypothetical protein
VSLGVKVPQHDVHSLPPRSAEVKNKWRYIPTSPIRPGTFSQWTARVVVGSRQKCGSRTQAFLCERIRVKRRQPQKKRASHDLHIVTGQGELRLEKRTVGT